MYVYIRDLEAPATSLFVLKGDYLDIPAPICSWNRKKTIAIAATYELTDIAMMVDCTRHKRC